MAVQGINFIHINHIELLLPKGYIIRGSQSLTLAEFKEVIFVILSLA